MVPNRHKSSDAYRYGFNGKEKDDEIKGEGTQYDYGFRIYDPRIGKFLSQDPLFKSYPWYTPYQFSGNSPISCVDLDGLEMYFAADGSFLGQSIHGGSEIRIATSYTTYKSDKKGQMAKVYRITSSQVLSQFGNLETAGKVYQTIYNREVKGDHKVKVIHGDPGEGGESTTGGPISLNVDNSTGSAEVDELANDYYYNVTSTLKHEEKHAKGLGSSGFEHFSIWESQIKDSSYSKTTPGYKSYLKDLGLQYIEHMESNLMNIDDDKNHSRADKNATFDKNYPVYLEAIKTYNELYKTDYKPAKKEDLRTKPQIKNIRTR